MTRGKEVYDYLRAFPFIYLEMRSTLVFLLV